MTSAALAPACATPMEANWNRFSFCWPRLCANNGTVDRQQTEAARRSKRSPRDFCRQQRRLKELGRGRFRLLAIASFIIHYLGWQALAKLLDHLSEMVPTRSSDLLPQGVPRSVGESRDVRRFEPAREEPAASILTRRLRQTMSGTQVVSAQAIAVLNECFIVAQCPAR
jgi:hypothetical protein